MIQEEIIYQCMEYILKHLEEDLTVGEIAEHFHFSEFYFTRAFKHVTGESVYAFVKRQKLDQSAMEIKQCTEKSITEIGENYGYSSSNYSSAFKKEKNISPVEFRKSANSSCNSNPFYPDKTEQFESFITYDEKMELQTLPDRKVVYERFIGSYLNLKEAWREFMDTHEDCIRENSMLVERFFDDPKVVEAGHCFCDLCISGTEAQDRKTTTLTGGEFAVYRYQGEIDGIYHTVQGIFSIWLPKSKYEMRERYGYHIYQEIDWERNYVVMDLCIPVR